MTLLRDDRHDSFLAISRLRKIYTVLTQTELMNDFSCLSTLINHWN